MNRITEVINRPDLNFKLEIKELLHLFKKTGPGRESCKKKHFENSKNDIHDEFY